MYPLSRYVFNSDYANKLRLGRHQLLRDSSELSDLRMKRHVLRLTDFRNESKHSALQGLSLMNMPEELDTSDGKFRKRVDEIIKSQVQFYCPDGVPTDSESISKECLPNFAYRNFLGTFDETLDTMEKDLLKRYFKIKAACEIGRRSYNVCYKLVRFDEGLRDLEAELDAAAVNKFSTLGERLDQLHKLYHGEEGDDCGILDDAVVSCPMKLLSECDNILFPIRAMQGFD